MHCIFLNKNLVFIDSMQFMNFSLQKLVKNLSDNYFKYLTEEFRFKNLELLKQKVLVLMSTWTVLKNLVKKNCLIKGGTTGDNGEKLGGHISDEDYLTCKKIWNEFSMKNMGEYYDHYLKKDVLLLADVFEKFIDTCLKFYGLDPCHYFSSPGLSWDAMLKMTGMRLKKVLDIDMYLFIEKGLRGGISYIAKRYNEANSKYMKNYDPTKLSKYIEYLDKNNLYGWAMSGYLPYSGFKWLKNVVN